MTDSPAVTPAKKTKAAKAKKPKTAPTHPKVSEMVDEAISSLKERGGSSLVAIKKYISANYKVDAEKLSTFIKKYLKNSVSSGSLVQTKGTGATGSFRIGGTEKKAPAKKPKKAASAKSPKPKKTKAAATPKKAAKPKKASAKKPKSPAKAKKVKTPVKKTKPAAKKPAAVKLVVAKPKKAKAKSSPKKAASKRSSKK